MNIEITKEFFDTIESAFSAALKQNALLTTFMLMTPAKDQLIKMDELIQANRMYADIFDFIEKYKKEFKYVK